VGADLKLLPRFFVDMGRAKDGVDLSFSGKRNRPDDARSRPLGGFDDVQGRAV